MATVDGVHDLVEEYFARDAPVFGRDLDVYRGHVHRVVGLVCLQHEPAPAEITPLAVSAYFHDAGIWFDRTWDYLPPSIARAKAELPAEHTELAGALIGEHHRLRRAHHPHPLVEALRRADLTDVSGGLVRSPGVPRGAYRSLVARYPARGFRPMLARAFARGVRESPLRPAPMVKL